MLQLISLLSAFVIFVSYVLNVVINYGKQQSISYSYYVIKHRWLFQVFIYALASCIILAGNTWLFLLSGLFLSIVGLTPTIKDKKLFPYHMIGAITSIILSHLSISLTLKENWYLYLIPTLCLTTGHYILKGKSKTYFFDTELLQFFLIFAGLLNIITTTYFCM